MARLERFHFHVAEQPEVEFESPPSFGGARAQSLGGFDGEEAGAGVGFEAAAEAEFEPVEPPFVTDEAAARHFLSEVLTEEDTPTMLEITAPERPEVVPDLRLARVQERPETGSRLVRFNQTKESIPVFGGHAVCELTADRGLVSASGEVGSVGDVSTIATVSQADALTALAKDLGVELNAIDGGQPPEQQLFPSEESKWHLVWLFRNVPVAPQDFEADPHGHGLGRSPRDVEPRFDYLVDAHEGTVVYSYPAAPTLMPTFGSGESEDDLPVEFFWQAADDGVFELRDTTRKIVTYDHELRDIDNHTLNGPIRGNSVNVGGAMKAAVSAHSNASIVDDFYRGVLKRNGIDNKGMELVNVINCTYEKGQETVPGVWHNAVWWQGRMWYGQAPDGNGVTRSYSRHLDVIAHELTHGVTSSTAGLVYRDQSGALNESYSDIFGVIVKNWDRTKPATGGDVSEWDWQLGSALGAAGKPLRDLSNPAATGDPAHMSEYLQTTRDSGGVHTNSNIHNKAAHNVLTATEADGSRTFTPYHGALLFYLGLEELGRLSNFHDSLTAVVNAANSLWKGDPQVRDVRVAAIRDSFSKVGIT
ncbi:MAG: M4 family metallopeptidase [Solirubrobacterales bacterium]